MSRSRQTRRREESASVEGVDPQNHERNPDRFFGSLENDRRCPPSGRTQIATCLQLETLDQQCASLESSRETGPLRGEPPWRVRLRHPSAHSEIACEGL